MSASDVTIQSVYDSLNSIRAQMQQRQLDEQRQQALLDYQAELQRQPPSLEQQQVKSQPVSQVAADADAPRQEQYMADKWLAEQKRIQAAREYSYGKMAQANLNADQYKQIKEYVDSKYDPTGEYAKSFRDTDLYKNAKTIAQEKDTTAQRNTIDLMRNTVDTISDISAPKNLSLKEQEDYIRQKKASQIKSFLTQLVNSAKGSADAEQAMEVLRRSGEIFSYPEIQALKNQGIFSATGIMSFLATREGNGIIDKIVNANKADPDAYLEKVRRIHDDLASTWNQRMKDQVITPTNKQIAENEFGIKMRKLYSEQQSEPPAVSVIRPEQAQAQQPTAQQPSMSIEQRAKMAADILRQRAAQRAAQQQSVISNPPGQKDDFTGKSAF